MIGAGLSLLALALRRVGLSIPAPAHSYDLVNTPGSVTVARTGTATQINASGKLEVLGTNTVRTSRVIGTWASEGILVEGPKINRFWDTKAPVAATWTGIHCTATAQGSVAADSPFDTGFTHGRLSPAATSNFHVIRQTPTFIFAGGSTVTLSAFVKAAGTSRLSLRADRANTDESGCDFDLGTGTAGTPYTTGADSNVTAVITPFPDGWFRCSITFVTGGFAGARRAGIWLLNASGANNYLGVPTNYLLCSGLELATGVLSSHVPNTSATPNSSATRGGDTVTLTGCTLAPTIGAAAIRWYNPYGSTDSDFTCLCMSGSTYTYMDGLGSAATLGGGTVTGPADAGRGAAMRTGAFSWNASAMSTAAAGSVFDADRDITSAIRTASSPSTTLSASTLPFAVAFIKTYATRPTNTVLAAISALAS